jgi:hypothetical protein
MHRASIYRFALGAFWFLKLLPTERLHVVVPALRRYHAWHAPRFQIMSANYDIDDLPNAAERKKNKVIAILIAVVAGAIVFFGGSGFFLAVGVYLISVNASTRFQQVAEGFGRDAGPRAKARAFLSDLGAGRIQNAHGSASKDFRQHWDLDSLQRMADVTPALQGSTLTEFRQEFTDQGRKILQGFVTGPNGKAEFRLELIEEDGEWKVDRMHFP